MHLRRTFIYLFSYHKFSLSLMLLSLTICTIIIEMIKLHTSISTEILLMLWVVVALFSVNSGSGIIQEDWHDGTIELSMIQTQHLYGYILSKIGVIFCTHTLPLITWGSIILYNANSPMQPVFPLIPAMLLLHLIFILAVLSFELITIIVSRMSLQLVSSTLLAPLWIPAILYFTQILDPEMGIVQKAITTLAALCVLQVGVFLLSLQFVYHNR